MFNKKLKADLAALESRNQELQSLNRDLLDQIDTLIDRKKGYKKEINHLHIEINRLKRINVSLETESINKHNELVETRTKRDEYHTLFTNSLKENERYRETINGLEPILKSKDEEITRLNTCIHSQDACLAGRDLTIASLEERNAQLAELLVTKDKEYNNVLNIIKEAVQVQS